MSKQQDEQQELDPNTVEGVKYLKQVFGLLQRLAPAGCQRDQAGNRDFKFSQYAGLLLLGLFNPIVQSVRGLSQLSELRKVQRVLRGPRVSIGSFSESVRVFDPALLEPILQELLAKVPPRAYGRPGAGIPEELVRRLTAVDGSALRVLPQIVAATGRQGGKWRLHLQLEVLRGLPERATVTPDEVGGAADERSVLAANLRAGRLYVIDRGYERYTLLIDIVAAGSDYVCRVQRRNVDVLEVRPLSAAARDAGVLSDELVQLGCSRKEVGKVEHPVRRIVIAGGVPHGPKRSVRPRSQEVVLLTNLLDVPAEVIAAIYRLRWSIELFFRFFKHVLGCHKLISHKPDGVAIQVYCALIAALLLCLATGRSVGRRGFELVCLYFQGWAEEDELIAGLDKLARSQKNG
jgi:hypothetical protein